MQVGKPEAWACDSREPGARRSAQRQGARASDDMGPAGQAGAQVREEGRGPMKVKTRHQEAKKAVRPGEAGLCELSASVPSVVHTPGHLSRDSEKGHSSPPRLLMKSCLCIPGHAFIYENMEKISSICPTVKDTKLR